MVHWDADGRKDLIAGLADGTVRLYLNIATDESPHFDGGTLLQVGEPGLKTNIDVGSRATPTVLDWNSDGKKDLVVGALSGKLYIFINEGSNAEPDFVSQELTQENGGDLIVPSVRSSPQVLDLDDDGKKDLLTGNTNGELLLYSNTGGDEAPAFSGYVSVESDGVPIDLPSILRSRPFVCDWTGDGPPDVLIGYGDGLVRLYQGEQPTVVAREEGLPAVPRACLSAAFPNPFGPRTTITFVLPEAGPVRLSVHDASGRRVTELGGGHFAAGPHQVIWQGLDGRGSELPPGAYFLRFETPAVSETKKLVLIR